MVLVRSPKSTHYEAPLLMPGKYNISASASGFKTSVREGISLQITQTLSIDLKLEAGALIDNQQLMDLPVLGNNPTLLTKFMPGIQTDGINNYLVGCLRR